MVSKVTQSGSLGRNLVLMLATIPPLFRPQLSHFMKCVILFFPHLQVPYKEEGVVEEEVFIAYFHSKISVGHCVGSYQIFLELKFYILVVFCFCIFFYLWMELTSFCGIFGLITFPGIFGVHVFY